MTIINFLNQHGGLAIWIAALITVTVGLMTIQTQRSINRRRATIDMFMQKIWDKDYLKASEGFADVMKDQTKLMNAHDMFIKSVDLKRRNEWGKLSAVEKEDLERAASTIYDVVRVLNDRELIAIGIRDGTYDEAICRRWWYSTFLREWKLSSTFVARIRTDPQLGAAAAAYNQMQELAERWESEGPWQKDSTHIKLFGGRSLVLTRSH
jgi:hypothetical protein